jgi:hypothetical protein
MVILNESINSSFTSPLLIYKWQLIKDAIDTINYHIRLTSDCCFINEIASNIQWENNECLLVFNIEIQTGLSFSYLDMYMYVCFNFQILWRHLNDNRWDEIDWNCFFFFFSHLYVIWILLYFFSSLRQMNITWVFFLSRIHDNMWYY